MLSSQKVNDAALNDREEKLPPPVVDNLRELGAFGLLVPTDLGGSGLTNSQYGRMTEIGGSYDLSISVFIAAHQV